ncbi:hypothetical protein FOL47_003982 [Perkinsus chesapeaki]|uniref:Uncharacterized protein n=1 Tax=Perkinsus chesapeaki TaxID=330153 RepID=A0A7J6MZG2_PERCH|nr:hypothetical protein FOL47_003982 [Perkinsus chesapeaki]
MLRLHCLFVVDDNTHDLRGVVTKASFDIPDELLPVGGSAIKATADGNDMIKSMPSQFRRHSIGSLSASMITPSNVLPFSMLFGGDQRESTSTIQSTSSSAGTQSAAETGIDEWMPTVARSKSSRQ